LKYRSEIDGLRAIAVIPVILFHAGFELFSGGFVGVDVFFVISGYLITTILIEDIENNRFSIVNFYERRARRILPALFFVMLVCIPFAWMWMLPNQFKDFSQSLVAVSLFASNILFWRESGYFDAAAEEKPLLHTWSLTVEEQYYFLFPIFLILTWRFGKNKVFWMIVLFSVVSLLLSEWGWRNKANANFFLFPTRAWELLAGSITAFIVQRRGVQSNNLLSLLGLAAIFYSIFVYDETTPFPSLYALVPVVGVSLLLLFADKKTLVAKLLSLKALVSIGLISYSAYLWHQPLFAFARIRMLDDPNVMTMTLLSVVSLILAFFSWRFIEQPFREKNNFDRLYVFKFSVGGIIFFLLIGYFGHVSNGFEKISKIMIERNIASNIYVIGDSHGSHLIPGLRKITKGSVVDFSSGGCIPFRDVDRYDSRFEVGACARKINSSLDRLKVVKEKSIVILSTMGPVYLDGTVFKGKGPERVNGLGVKLISNPEIEDHYKVFETGLQNTLRELLENKNLTIIYTIDIPELGIDNGCGANTKEIELFGFAVSDLSGNIMLEPAECFVDRQLYDERALEYKALVSRVLKNFEDVILIDPTYIFCNDLKCKGFDENFGYLYRDYDHLSVAGSLYFAREVSKVIQYLEP
jgi:peptidoglycan/LPS O-acetylase OafA/YrhL